MTLPAHETPRQLAEVDFCGWPAYRLQQGALRLHVVPQIGGRLMGISLDEKELSFINPSLMGRRATDDPDEWTSLCGDWTWPLWGGGKTWVAPESAWPNGEPHRDLDSGAWHVISRWFDEAEMGIEVESPICRQSGLQLRRRLSLPNAGTRWRIEHKLTNKGNRPITCGLWDVLMLVRPAIVRASDAIAVPGEASTAVTHLRGGANVQEMLDSGMLRASEGTIEIDCRKSVEFKVGFPASHGEVSAALEFPEGLVSYQRRAEVPPRARFAHGHPLEVFNAAHQPYFEIETHSPVKTLAPGGFIVHTIDEELAFEPSR